MDWRMEGRKDGRLEGWMDGRFSFVLTWAKWTPCRLWKHKYAYQWRKEGMMDGRMEGRKEGTMILFHSGLLGKRNTADSKKKTSTLISSSSSVLKGNLSTLRYQGPNQDWNCNKDAYQGRSRTLEQAIFFFGGGEKWMPKKSEWYILWECVAEWSFSKLQKHLMRIVPKKRLVWPRKNTVQVRLVSAKAKCPNHPSRGGRSQPGGVS